MTSQAGALPFSPFNSSSLRLRIRSGWQSADQVRAEGNVRWNAWRPVMASGGLGGVVFVESVGVSEQADRNDIRVRRKQIRIESCLLTVAACRTGCQTRCGNRARSAKA